MVQFLIPEKLETHRLVIRPFFPKDLMYFTKFMLDPKATKYLNFTQDQLTEKGAKQLFQMVSDSYSSDSPIFALVIALKEEDQFIGSCGLSPIADKNVVECYYSLLPEYWGNGYATEAIKKMIEYGFKSLEIKKIIAHINLGNVRSEKLANNIGMTYEGIETNEETGLSGKLFSIKKSAKF